VLDCIRILDAVSILIFDGFRLSGIERSNYIESNNLGRKSCPVSGIERIRYSGCFITLKNRRGKFGTDEIVRFHGDSGIERIRFRGVLLYLFYLLKFSAIFFLKIVLVIFRLTTQIWFHVLLVQ